MRGNLIVAVLLALAGTCARAQAIANGLYAVTGSGGEVVKDLDGSEIHLGEKLGGISGAALISVSNNNQRYSLRFGLADEAGRVALYADGFCLSFRTNRGINDIWFESSNAAQAFAKFLGIQPSLRVHPGYALATRFVPTKKTFSGEESLTVTLELENVGHVPVTFHVGGRNRGPRDNQFGFTAFGPFGAAVPDTGDPSNIGGLIGSQTLRPGETFRKEVDLRKWFAFSQPGVYQLYGMFDLPFSAADSFNIVWSDVAAAPFSVTIK
jgi:hypothetical protein